MYINIYLAIYRSTLVVMKLTHLAKGKYNILHFKGGITELFLPGLSKT